MTLRITITFLKDSSIHAFSIIGTLHVLLQTYFDEILELFVLLKLFEKADCLFLMTTEFTIYLLHFGCIFFWKLIKKTIKLYFLENQMLYKQYSRLTSEVSWSFNSSIENHWNGIPKPYKTAPIQKIHMLK